MKNKNLKNSIDTLSRVLSKHAPLSVTPALRPTCSCCFDAGCADNVSPEDCTKMGGTCISTGTDGHQTQCGDKIVIPMPNGDDITTTLAMLCDLMPSPSSRQTASTTVNPQTDGVFTRECVRRHGVRCCGRLFGCKRGDPDGVDRII